jgi:menaquinol-cytochrome c reductase iron-sulfur subunit
MQAELPELTNCQSTTRYIERRAILTGALCALSSLVVGGMTSPAAAYLFSDPADKEKASDWTDAGDVPDLQPGRPEQITFERSRTDGWKAQRQKDSAWVVLDSNGKLTAFSPLCTHLGCAYRWSAEKKEFLCPCHGSRFSAAGDVLAGPASRPLVRLSTKIEGPRLWLGATQKSEDS